MTTEAAIIAQVPSYLSFAADGTKVLDKEGLRSWVTGQMFTTLAANATPYYSLQQAQGMVSAAITPLLDRLAATIAPAHWSARADWPMANTGSQKEISSNRSAAVLKAIGDLKVATTKVLTDYDALNASKAEWIKNKMFDEGFAPFLPTPVIRQIDTRFYVTTLVTDWGEESSPSLVCDLLTVDQNDTVTIPKPTIPSGHGVVGWRLYRSNSGNQSAAFQLVADIAATNAVLTASGGFDYFNLVGASYTDAIQNSKLQEVIPTTDWLEPPANLSGLVGVANGIMAGYFDNTLCFCEPYAPYAWPVKYRLTTKFPIMGLGSFGQTVFVGTRGSPYLASGADSASMSLQELPSNQACVASRSIVSTGNGAIYASPDGLCMADYNGVKVITLGLFTREDWQALKPESIVAALHDGAYYFLWNNGTTSGCYALDFNAGKLVQVQISGSALFSDQITDTLYAVNGTSISALFSTGRRTGLYRTGIVNVGRHQPFAWLQVDSDFTANVTVRWYGDGVLRHTATVTGTTPVRLPPGRYLEHEVEIETTAKVTSVTLAGSTQELQAV